MCFCISVTARANPSSAAFYYGPDIPWNELSVFDIAVVEPAQSDSPPADKVAQFYAYVSIGEVLPSRDYAAGVEPQWVLGDNPDWGTWVLDLSNPALRDYLLDNLLRPLYEQGYRGFFLDTLDSYQLAATTDAQREVQRRGLQTLIKQAAKRFPGVRLVLNRGFELLPKVHQYVDAVAAESLFQRWLPSEQRYQAVSDDDRQWLLDRFREVRENYGIATIAIDYAPPGARDQARELAEKIGARGVIPWVSNPALDMLGVGALEVLPRRVLMIHDTPAGERWEESNLIRYGLMPAQFLGLVPDIRAIDSPMPAGTLTGRYAGIITWLENDRPHRPEFAAWLGRQVDAGVPVAMFAAPPLDVTGPVGRRLGFSTPPAPRSLPRVDTAHPLMGFEAPLPALIALAQPVAIDDARPWLSVSADGNQYTPVAITDWGGFAFDPFVVRSILPGVRSEEITDRWMLNPLVFLREALKLPAMPVPDVTTENGRRLMMVHIDGDGFPSLAEVEGYRGQAAAEVLQQEILKRYRVPTTLSVIEGEVADTGLYPERSKELEDIAQRMFLLDHVEAATHTFSHPFFWYEAQRYPQRIKGSRGDLRLDVPDYQFDLRREIIGSARYIEEKLLPPGKDVQMVLWSGDTMPTEEALEVARKGGLLNMNGSDTTITESNRTWTLIKGIGLPKGDEYQVYAPNQNENIYTGNWSGPFYGFERVIETFKLTNTPIRFKPVDIYYHTYIASKNASLESLRRVYDWALAQPLHPIFASEYARKVLNFNDIVIARDGDTWVVRGSDALRTLRLPEGLAAPALDSSDGLAGVHRGDSGTYLHLTGGPARWQAGGGTGTGKTPALWEANGRLLAWRRVDGGVEFSLRGWVPLAFTLVQPPGCELRQDESRLTPVARDGDRYQYRSEQRELRALRLDCGA
ncbi:MAG TPA: endo alpha-1,4 polygalactosaminidase [Alcanivorax sp.]|nr:endo alpha-1,4 polygalactosaminidase [Alcanivorax sp.]